jgi:Xaa-Pro dipeptidase
MTRAEAAAGARLPGRFNWPRLAEFMDAARLDAVLLATPANVTWATGYSYWADAICERWMLAAGDTSEPVGARAVVTRSGQVALVVPEVLATNAEPAGDGFDVVGFGARHMSRHRTLHDALVAAIREHGLGSARIGLDRDGMALIEAETIREQLPHCLPVSCSNVLRLARAVKTEVEIEALRRAADLSESAACKALSLARTGSSIQAVCREYRRQVVEADADPGHFMVGHDGGICADPRHVLSEAAVSYVDFGCRLDSVYADTGLTLATRDIARARKRYGELRDALELGRESLRPGAHASSVFDAMSGALERRGLGEANVEGHGIGLQLRDYPLIQPRSEVAIVDDCLCVDSDLLLEAGMAINLEISLFEGEYSYQIEQTFLVRSSGAELLTCQPREELTLAAAAMR